MLIVTTITDQYLKYFWELFVIGVRNSYVNIFIGTFILFIWY